MPDVKVVVEEGHFCGLGDLGWPRSAQAIDA